MKKFFIPLLLAFPPLFSLRFTWLLICFLGYAAILPAQNTPGGAARPAATPVALPATYTNTTINYIRTWEPSMPVSDPATITSSSNLWEVKQSTQYFDGLGRPVQTVIKGITPSGKDLVTPVVYDIYGREQYKYLPYVPQSGNSNDGKFKTTPFSSQQSFYQNLVPGAAGESIYYSQIEYEASPLNRMLRTYAPGNTWAKNDPTGIEKGGHRPVEQQYLVNTTADEVRIWNIPATGVVPTSSGSYAAGELLKNVTTDEQTLRVVEFTDKEGRMVLKRTALTNGAADGHTGWLSTYYIYDYVGNLRGVIPPKAVDIIRNASWTIDATTAAELCFFYRYDGRNRMIIKKVPGADSTEMVYDVRDRLAFSRDGNMKAGNQWLVTFYDEMNRPSMTALYNSNAARESLQTSMNTATSNTQSISYTFPGIADLVVGNYDGRAEYKATQTIDFVDGYDTGAGATTDAYIDTAINEGITNITVTNPLPNIAVNSLTPLTYTFYSNYNFTGAQPAQTGDFNRPQAGTNPYPEANTGVSSLIKGMVTGTKVKVLGTPDKWLTTTIYYNDKGRVIQTIADNIGGSLDVSTNLYDFSGKLLSNYLRHKNQRSGSTPQTTMLTNFTYDAAGRLTITRKRLNDNDAFLRTIASNTYDELGQLQKKRLGLRPATNQFLDSLQYEYNIRGWLKAINKAYVTTPGSTSNWFGQELSYDYGFITNQYNGNIGGIRWKSKGDGISRAYGYGYDRVNRLLTADFTQQNTALASWTRDQKDFSVSGLSYDANGNIGTMTQKGMIAATIATIDQLSYTYASNSNKLLAVADPSNTTTANLGDFISRNTTGNDYAYDANGSLTKDLNKNINSIRYNILNLPDSIVFTGKGTIRYYYDAAGNKLRKIVTDNTTTPPKITTTDYIGGFVYQNDSLQFLSHEEGRVRTIFRTGQPIDYAYDYFLKDHLGNVRMVLTEQTEFSMYAATMEIESAPIEAALFSNVEETRTARPAGYPQEDTSLQNAFVAKLNAKDGGRKIGPSIVLRVMAGDTVQIGARAFYKSTAPVDNKSATPEDMIASLVQAFAGSEEASDVHSSAQADRLTPFRNFSSNDYQRLKEKDADENIVDKPRAYLNFVLFDDQFNLVDENSGVRQVKATPDELQALAVDKMPITKTGYLYVYTSNEAAQDVFFDNVILGLTEGPLLEETHYYPFGLTMAGISANALKGSKYPENRKRFQGQDFDNELGLDWYGFRYRNHDPQTGRFIQIDPLSDKYPYNSTYAFSENKVTSHVELEGLESIPFQYNGANTMAVANLFRSESKQISKEIILNTQKVENAANAKAAPLLPATVMAPELSIPYALTLLTGAPVLPSPQAMSTSLTASSLEAGVQTEGSSNTLFHYTSEIGYNGILESGELNASIGLKNARHGNGQYFTDIAPSSVGATSKSVLTTTQVQEGQISLGQLSSKLYGMPFKTGSLTHYIEVDVKGIQISNPKNNIFLNNSNTSLNLGGRIKSHGLTMGN